jgi:hypothetical protein
MAVTPHIHLGFIEFVIVGLYFILWGFLLRIISIAAANTTFGQALSFIH